jgi:hypothetical protein
MRTTRNNCPKTCHYEFNRAAVVTLHGGGDVKQSGWQASLYLGDSCINLTRKQCAQIVRENRKRP